MIPILQNNTSMDNLSHTCENSMYAQVLAHRQYIDLYTNFDHLLNNNPKHKSGMMSQLIHLYTNYSRSGSIRMYCHLLRTILEYVHVQFLDWDSK